MGVLGRNALVFIEQILRPARPSINCLRVPRFVGNSAVLDVALVLILATPWYLDFPHRLISAFIGKHFPWPTARPPNWPALLLERTLIEAIVCLEVSRRRSE
jgi:hypothetical protein